MCSVSVLRLLYETTTEGHIEGVAVGNKFGVTHEGECCLWMASTFPWFSIKCLSLSFKNVASLEDHFRFNLVNDIQHMSV